MGSLEPNLTDTLGWDTVFALPANCVNEIIRRRKSSPASFTVSIGRDTLSGSFGDWQMVDGGSGSLVRLALPLTQVTGKSPYGAYTCEQATSIVEVGLEFVAHPETCPDNANVRQHDLKVSTASTNPNNPPARLVTTQWTADPCGPAVDLVGVEGIQGLIEQLLTDWLKDNLAQFDHVFAAVDLNETIDQDAEWAWARPTGRSYAYVDSSTPGAGLLGVLCMTGRRAAGSQQIQQLDTFVVPAGSLGGFLVSQERLLNDLMKPALPVQFPGSDLDDYEVVQNADTGTGRYQYVLRLIPGRRVPLQPVVQDQIPYLPVLKELTIGITGSLVTFQSYTETEINKVLQITAYCRTTHTYTISLGSGQKGQTLVYQQYTPPAVDHGVVEGPNSNTYKLVEAVIAAVSLAILSVLTDGAALVVASVIVALATSVVAALPDILAAVNTDQAPSIDLLVINATNPIRWDSGSDFKLDYAALNGPLQLGGNPTS